jgi:hypothetical protein
MVIGERKKGSGSPSPNDYGCTASPTATRRASTSSCERSKGATRPRPARGGGHPRGSGESLRRVPMCAPFSRSREGARVARGASIVVPIVGGNRCRRRAVGGGSEESRKIRGCWAQTRAAWTRQGCRRSATLAVSARRAENFSVGDRSISRCVVPDSRRGDGERKPVAAGSEFLPPPIWWWAAAGRPLRLDALRHRERRCRNRMSRITIGLARRSSPLRR